MSGGVIFVDRDNDVCLVGYMLDRDFSAINDAIVVAHLARLDRTGTITDATNVSQIVITTAEPHELEDGDEVLIGLVEGNLAANGAHEITVLTPTTFRLDGVPGDGDYLSGGTWWLAVESATNVPMPYEAGSRGNYRGAFSGEIELTAGNRYVRVIQVQNYVDRWQSILTAQISS